MDNGAGRKSAVEETEPLGWLMVVLGLNVTVRCGRGGEGGSGGGGGGGV